MRIGFLGLGTMGAPMARRLLEGGHIVAGFDLSADARVNFANAGGIFCDTSGMAAENADVLITMLPDETAVENAIFGTNGAVETLASGALLLEMSTSDARYIHACAAKMHTIGVRVMDVPVGRGVREAGTGDLLVLAGGAADDFAAALPLLRNFAKQEDIIHVGALGTAIRLKLINNYLSLINMVVAAEGLTFARMAGVDRTIALRVFGATPAGRGQLLTNFPRKVLSGDVSPDFPLRLGLKDLTLALQLGSDLGAPLHLGAIARQAYSIARSWGRSEQDCTAMLYLLEDIAGLKSIPGNPNSSAH